MKRRRRKTVRLFPVLAWLLSFIFRLPVLTLRMQQGQLFIFPVHGDCIAKEPRKDHIDSTAPALFPTGVRRKARRPNLAKTVYSRLQSIFDKLKMNWINPKCFGIEIDKYTI